MSSVVFDPYHKWLGIPKSDQPPHHYRLLGIPLFEDDLQVIEGAADRQMAFLRKFQSGEHASDAMKLLNEISRARLCLLKPEQKAAYDTALRGKLEAAKPAAQPLPSTPTWQQPAVMAGAGMAVLLLIGTIFLLTMTGRGEDERPPAAGEENTVAKADKGDEQGAGAKSEQKSEQSGGSEPGRPPSQSNPQVAAVSKKIGGSKSGNAPGNAQRANGATVPQRPVNPINLLSVMDTNRNLITGTWKLIGANVISSVRDRFASIRIPTVAPADFDLIAEVTRDEGTGSLLLAFPVQGHQSGIALDGWGGVTSGLETIGTAHPDTQPDAYSGKVLELGKTVRVVCQIRRGVVTVVADGRLIIEWKGEPADLSVDPRYGLGPNASLAIGSREGQFTISRLELVPVKSTPQSAGEGELKTSVDLMARLDIGRDSADGEWTLENGVLSGQSTAPSGVARLNVPYQPPQQYDLAVIVERQLPQGSFAIGLPIQGNQCAVVLDTGARNDIQGISQVDGKPAHLNESSHREKTLVGGERVNIQCNVRRNHIIVQANGKVIVDWRGDVSRLTAPAAAPFVNPNDLMLVAQGGWFHVKGLVLTPVKEESVIVAQAPAGREATPSKEHESSIPGSLVPAKLPTPSADALEVARKQIRETFKVEYGMAKKAENRNTGPRIALANSLYAKAQNTDDDPAACYVLMSEAAEYASNAGQLDLAWEILQALGERYDQTPLPLMLQAAKDVRPFAKSPEEITVLDAMYVRLLEAAIQADDFDTAAKATQDANTVSRKVQTTGLKEQLAVWGRRANQLREAFAVARPAREILLTDTNHEASNLAWGRYVAFNKGDWTDGLPFLAKSGDAKLAELAKRDLDQPRTVDLLTQLGDDWWAVSEREKEPLKSIIAEHAVYFWQTAWPLAQPVEQQALDLKVSRMFGATTKTFVTDGSGSGIAVAGPEISPQPLYTIEFWCRTTAENGVLISKRHKTPESSIVVALDSGYPVIMAESAGRGDRARGRKSINDGRWHHVAAVRVGSRLGLFVDGRSAAQTNFTIGLSSGSPWKVGHQEAGRHSEIPAKFCRIRFSKDARYLVDFVPEKSYTKDKATAFVP